MASGESRRPARLQSQGARPRSGRRPSRRRAGSTELGILAYLNAHPGQIIPRKALIHSVWGQHADVKSRPLDQYIVKVRDLFTAHGLNLNSFKTVYGIGYTFEPPPLRRKKVARVFAQAAQAPERLAEFVVPSLA
ncbi:MAG: winged helix family transcriptional regulator [Opitutus sp.]|nr:winged helix family transcriptional regulator [Opitutus sp.]